LAIAQRTAGAFGWAKPYQSEAVTKVRHIETDFMANCDGAEPAIPLAGSACNQLSPTFGYGDSESDEMSIDYIKTRWGVYDRFGWPSSSAAGVILYTITVRPGSCWLTSEVPSTATVFRYTPIGWLQSFFYFWRGSLRFRLRIAKTKFHSGRLLFTYCPGTSNNYAAPVANVATAANYPLLLTDVVDIREASIVEFTVPFMSPRLYNSYLESTGTVRIIVANALIAPEVVANSVDCTIEVCGGDDLEFAAPRSSSYIPVLSHTSGLLDAPEVVNQSGLVALTGPSDVLTNEETRGKVIGGLASVESLSTSAAEEAIGEQFTSIKQLAMISTQFLDKTSASVNLPGLMTVGDLDGTALIYNTDQLSQVMAPYRFIRGSVIYRLMHLGTDPLLINTGPSLSNSTTGGATVNTRSRQVLLSSGNPQNLVSFKMPFYHHYGVYVNAFANATFTTASIWMSPRFQAAVGSLLGSSVRQFIYRAAADDFQAFSFLAVPLTAVTPL